VAIWLFACSGSAFAAGSNRGDGYLPPPNTSKLAQTVDARLTATPAALGSEFWRNQAAYSDFLRSEGESAVDVGPWTDLDEGAAEASAAASAAAGFWRVDLPGFRAKACMCVYLRWEVRGVYFFAF